MTLVLIVPLACAAATDVRNDDDARFTSAGHVASDGVTWILGGYEIDRGQPKASDRVRMIDAQGDVSTMPGRLPVPIAESAAAMGPRGVVILGGVRDALRSQMSDLVISGDPQTGTWTVLPHTLPRLRAGGLAFAEREEIHILGGRSCDRGPMPTCHEEASVWIFNLSTGSHASAPLPTAKFGGALLNSKGRMTLLSATSDIMWEYDSSSRALVVVSTNPAILTPHTEGRAGILELESCFAGGVRDNAEPVNDVICYDAASGAIYVSEPLSHRQGFAVPSPRGKFIVGGTSDCGVCGLIQPAAVRQEPFALSLGTAVPITALMAAFIVRRALRS